MMKTQKHHSLTSVVLPGLLSITFLIALFLTTSCSQKKESLAQDTTSVSGSKVAAPEVDIHTAVLTENEAALQQHIKAGSDLNEKDPFGGSSPLISAAVFGKTAMAKILIDAGADINFKNNYGATTYESVAAPFKDAKESYDMMGKVLGPMGLTLDYAYLEKTRPEIAALLK